MNKRILKIDPDHKMYGDNLSVRVDLSGRDADGDRIGVELKDEDAREFVRLAQALAGQESRTTDQLIAALDERRTLPGGG